MIYQAQNTLVIESKTLDGCRVLLNRSELLKLQDLELVISHCVERKSLIIRPTILKEFEMFGNYIDREFTQVKSPPKTNDEMKIFIKNLREENIIAINPGHVFNFISQLKMFATTQLSERWAQRWSGENSSGVIKSLIYIICINANRNLLFCRYIHSISLIQILFKKKQHYY